jgi:hypothetical protein
MPQVLELLSSKSTFSHFDLPFISVQQFKDLPNMLHMLLIGMAEDQYIIEKDQDTFPKKGTQSQIHGLKKCSRCAR